MRVLLIALPIGFASCSGPPCETYCDNACAAIAECGVNAPDCHELCSELVTDQELTDRECSELTDAVDDLTCVGINELVRVAGWH